VGKVGADTVIVRMPLAKDMPAGVAVVCTPSPLLPHTTTLAPLGDRGVLVDIYGALRGDDWKRKDHWVTSSEIGSWYGVTVENGKVRLHSYFLTAAFLLPWWCCNSNSHFFLFPHTRSLRSCSSLARLSS
jgi:hypothetical protein